MTLVLRYGMVSYGAKGKYDFPPFKVMDMDEKLQQAYLYDFYGELLNEHQRQIYEDFYFNDLSLGEIAEEEGISRQGVSDMVKRCEKKLMGYEEKLHLVQKFLSIKKEAEQLHELAGNLQKIEMEVTLNDQNQAKTLAIQCEKRREIIRQIECISNQIIEEL